MTEEHQEDPAPTNELDGLKAEIAALKELITKPKEEPLSNKPEPTRLELQYAARLKKELGDKYNERYDSMEVGTRIDTMEAVIEALKGKIDPLHKDGEGNGGVGGNAPPMDNKPKTFLDLQKEKSYREKLRDRGSYAAVANKLYNRE